MRMTIYGICKKFPSVNHISCEQLEKWRVEQPNKLVVLVSCLGFVLCQATPTFYCCDDEACNTRPGISISLYTENHADLAI